MKEWVWLKDERCFGELIYMGAYYSRIVYTRAGIEYDVMIENSDYEIVDGEDKE